MWWATDISVECGLPFVAFSDVNIVMTLVYIKLGEIACTFELVE